jgi:hypothetical protein
MTSRGAGLLANVADDVLRVGEGDTVGLPLCELPHDEVPLVGGTVQCGLEGVAPKATLGAVAELVHQFEGSAQLCVRLPKADP